MSSFQNLGFFAHNNPEAEAQGSYAQSAWKGSLSVELKGIVIISILNLNIKFFIFLFQCPKLSYNNVMLPEDSNAVVWKTVRLWLMVVGRQKSWYMAWKGKILWLMAACLPPLVLSVILINPCSDLPIGVRGAL